GASGRCAHGAAGDAGDAEAEDRRRLRQPADLRHLRAGSRFPRVRSGARLRGGFRQGLCRPVCSPGHPHEQRAARLHRQPAGEGGARRPHPDEAIRHGARDRRYGRLPAVRSGQLHHRTESEGGWRDHPRSLKEAIMSDTSFDLIVIGSGPGGYTTAIRAAQLGMQTAIVEREHLGGICLNWGCIPTKALLRSAEIYSNIRHAESFGFTIEGKVTINSAKVIERSRKVAAQLSAGVKHLMKKNKIPVFDVHGALNGPGKVKVTKDGKPVADLTAKHIILATGARARSLPGLEPDGKLVWTYKEAMVPPAMPKSLLVIGS